MDLSIQEQEDAKAHLMATDEEFRRIAVQHAEVKRRVAEIEANPHQSDFDVQEEARLKKLKLALKDKMMEMMHLHRETLPA
jgi:uncharacterized protein YdcH (DUF465 family)